MVSERTMRRIITSLVCLILVLTGILRYPAVLLAATGVPEILNHQGRLLDGEGNLLGGDGTDFCFRFSMYSDSVVGAPDTALWPSSAPSTMTVEVVDGVYSVGIGDTSADGDALDFDFFDTDEAYLNIEVAEQISSSCTGVTFETLSPRLRIGASGYAINSNSVGGYTPSQSAVDEQIPVLTDGSLVLGDTNPSVTATGSNSLTLQGSSVTGSINFFNATNSLTSTGDLTIAGDFVSDLASFASLSVSGSSTLSGVVTTGSDLTVTGDITISGNNLSMGINTSGFLLIANGTDFTPIGVSGDASLSDLGVLTIQSNAVDLASDTSGNYLATLSDAGAGDLSITGSGSENAAVTIDIVDDALDFTELADALTLDSSTDVALGSSTLSTSGTGALSFASTGQVTFAGNVDATNGADVTGAFTVSGVTTLAGAVAAGSTFSTAGNTTVGGDLIITGDDLFLTTNTDGFILVADGINYNPVAVSGDVILASNGTTTLTPNAAELGADTTGNYLAVFADAGAGDLTVTGSGSESASVTIDITDDALDFTEFADSLTLDAATDIAIGSSVLSTSGTGALSFVSTGQVTFAGNVDANAGADVTGALTVSGASTLSGAVSAGSTLSVSGASTLSSVSVSGESTLTGAVSTGSTLSTTGNTTVGGDLTVTGDDLFMATNTSGFILVADGTNYNPVAISGDISFSSTGATTIDANSVALGTDSTGNYLATLSDAGSGDISISGSGSETAAVTVDIVDDALDFTELADSLTLDAATNIALGSVALSTSGTGALSFASTGQVTFAGNVDANSGLDVTGALTVSTTSTLSGAVSVGSTLGVTGATTLSSTASVAGALAANGGITFDNSTDTLGAHTLAGTLDANTNLLTNIGDSGTDFVSGGGITFAGHVTLSSDSSEGLSGGGLSDCDTASTSKLMWDATTNKFSCGSDQNSGSATAFDVIGDPSGNGAVAMNETVQTLDWNTASTAAAFDGLTYTITNDGSTDATSQRLFVLQNANSTGSTNTERLLVLDNADTDEAVTTALEISSAAGAITTAIDASDSDIVTALAIGSNDITTTSTTISATELDRLDGKDAALLDTNDAVSTAITGVGTLSSISVSGTSTLTGAVSIGSTLSTTGNTTVGGDVTISGDDLFMATNTSGFILVADGTNYNPVAISGDMTISSTGAVTIGSNSIALGTDTTGNYLATLSDAGSGDISISGSGSETAAVTIDIVDDALDFTELADSLTLDAATNIALGSVALSTSGTGALSFASTGQVTFAGNVDANSGFDVTGALTVSTTSTLSGAVTAGSTLGVTGATTLSSTLAVAGTSTLTGAVSIGSTLSTTGNATIGGDVTISGDDLFMATNTSGFILVADGTNYNPVAISGDISISSTGATTIGSNSIALGTDTTGNYLATLSDAGSGDISISGSGSETAAVTVDIVDDALDFTELADSLTLDAATAIVLGSATLSTSGTGALSFASTGQVTFAGNVDANSGVDVTGALTVSTTTSLSGAVSAGSTLGVTGATTLSSTASVAGALAANGGITFDNSTDTLGAHTLSGTLDANTNLLTNIGDSGTDFVSGGGITFAGHVTLSSDSSEGLSGGGLSDCDTASSSKLMWDASTNKFSCGSDQTSSTATTFDAIGDPSGNGAVAMAETVQTLDWNTASTAAVFDGMTYTITNDSSTDSTSQRLFILQNANTTGSSATERLFVLDNADTNEAVTTALEISSAAGAITTAIDATDSDIVTALAIGSNDITTTSTTISATELDRLDGKDATLLDTNDAVSTAITGLGTLSTLTTSGNATIGGDVTISGDDLFMATNTSGFILVADGTNYNPVAISGDMTISSAGAVTIGSNSIALGTDTTGNYLATLSDAGSGDISISGSGSETAAVTVDIVDDALDFTELGDTLTLDAALSISGSASRTIDWSRTLTNATAENAMTISTIATDTTSATSSQFGLYVDNVASTEALDASIVLDNSDTDDVVGTAIKIIDAGGGFTSVIDNAGTLISGAELNRLDGKDAALVDQNDLTASDGSGATSSGSGLETGTGGIGLIQGCADGDILTWNDSSAVWQCGPNGAADTATFTDTTTELASFTTAADIWDGTFPNITVNTATATVLIAVNIRGTSDDANDQNPVFTIRRAQNSNPTCSSTQVGGEFVGDFLTANSEDWGASATFVDTGAFSASDNVRYTICTTTTGLDDGNTDEIRVSLVELGADLAENYYTTDDSIGPGDVVELDPSIPAGVKKASSPYNKNVIGVVSTAPGIILDDATGIGYGRAVPVALAGRIPVMVSTENGVVKAGDLLTSSSEPGVAMKATQAGQIIGQAMQDYGYNETQGLISMFIKTDFYNGTSSDQTTLDLTDLALVDGITFQTTGKFLHGILVDSIGSLSDLIAIQNDTIFFGRPYFNADMGGFARVSFGDRMVRVEFEDEYLDQPVVTASLTIESSDGSSVTAQTEQAFFNSGLSFIVTDKNTTGFTILLNRSAPADLLFSWTALAIRDARTEYSESGGHEEIRPSNDLQEIEEIEKIQVVEDIIPVIASETKQSSESEEEMTEEIAAPSARNDTEEEIDTSLSTELVESIEVPYVEIIETEIVE